MRVLIVDDHPVVVAGCRALFTSDASVEVLEASDAKAGHRAYLQNHPDVTVVDVRLPDLTGFELTRRIRKDDPAARIVMLAANENPAFVVRAVEMGIQGYVSKGDDPRLLVKAIRKVAAGERFVSPHLAEATTFGGAAIKASPLTQMSARELEILQLLGRGDRILEVASELCISYKTVANATSALKTKLGAKSHSDLCGSPSRSICTESDINTSSRLAGASKLKYEGIVSKRVDAPYRSERVEAWQKIKTVQGENSCRPVHQGPATCQGGRHWPSGFYAASFRANAQLGAYTAQRPDLPRLAPPTPELEFAHAVAEFADGINANRVGSAYVRARGKAAPGGVGARRRRRLRGAPLPSPELAEGKYRHSG